MAVGSPAGAGISACASVRLEVQTAAFAGVDAKAPAEAKVPTADRSLTRWAIRLPLKGIERLMRQIVNPRASLRSLGCERGEDKFWEGFKRYVHCFFEGDGLLG